MALDDIQDIPNPGRDPNWLTDWKNWKKVRAFGLTAVTGTGTANRVAYWTAAQVLAGSANLTFDGTTLTLTGVFTLSSTLNANGFVNVGGAVNTTSHLINVHSGYIATDNTFGFRSFGVGAPTNIAFGNSEYIEMSHNGAGDAMITVTKSGTGSYRRLKLQTGGADALILGTDQSATLPNLAGTGSRLVQADSNGKLSAPTAITALYQVLWTKTASTTIANTVTETSCWDTGVGSKILSAAFLTVGKTVFFEVVGYYSTLLTPTLQFKFKLGSTVILDSGAILAASSVSNQQVRFRGQFTCRSTGATGTIFAQGEVVIAGLSTPLVTVTNTAATTVDTTGTLAADATTTWGTASASDTITWTNSTLEAEG